jgi:hypothetical protein
MSDWPLQSECKAFYGNPDPLRTGVPSRKWEDEHLISIASPWEMVLAWDRSARVKSIRIHKKCSESLLRVLNRRWRDADESQSFIEAHHMHLYGGAYNFRLKRGGHTLSMHAFGCAIDHDPENNPMGKPWEVTGMIPTFVIKAYKDEGWIWGGDFADYNSMARDDAMHFQAARIR